MLGEYSDLGSGHVCGRESVMVSVCVKEKESARDVYINRKREIHIERKIQRGKDCNRESRKTETYVRCIVENKVVLTIP